MTTQKSKGALKRELAAAKERIKELEGENAVAEALLWHSVHVDEWVDIVEECQKAQARIDAAVKRCDSDDWDWVNRDEILKILLGDEPPSGVRPLSERVKIAIERYEANYALHECRRLSGDYMAGFMYGVLKGFDKSPSNTSRLTTLQQCQDCGLEPQCPPVCPSDEPQRKDNAP